MNPFAILLNSIRTRHGIRQQELSDLIGYEQTYISAVEVGKKGPPTQEFIGRLVAALELSAEESQQLHDAADASQRKFVINGDLAQDVYWVLRDLRHQLPELDPVQIRMIRFALELKGCFKERPKVFTQKIKRLRTDKKVEANM